MPRVAYAQDGSLLRAAGCVLGIGPRATCTALLFLHRYHAALRGLEPAAASASAVDDLVAVCLYSAAKVEEVVVSTSALLNTLHYLRHNAGSSLVCDAFPSLAPPLPQRAREAQIDPSLPSISAHPPPSGASNDDRCAAHEAGTGAGASSATAATAATAGAAAGSSGGALVGAAYYAAKAALLHGEQVLLRLLRFNVAVEHPFRHLFAFCRLLGASGRCAAAAAATATLALQHTDVCVDYEAPAVAAGCLLVASRYVGEGGLRAAHGRFCDEEWIAALGLRPDTVSAVAQEAAALLEALAECSEPGALAAAGHGSLAQL